MGDKIQFTADTESGTSQSGGSSGSNGNAKIKLASSASDSDDFYNNYVITIQNADISGMGQDTITAVISDYVGSTRLATLTSMKEADTGDAVGSLGQAPDSKSYSIVLNPASPSGYSINTNYYVVNIPSASSVLLNPDKDFFTGYSGTEDSTGNWTMKLKGVEDVYQLAHGLSVNDAVMFASAEQRHRQYYILRNTFLQQRLF